MARSFRPPWVKNVPANSNKWLMRQECFHAPSTPYTYRNVYVNTNSVDVDTRSEFFFGVFITRLSDDKSTLCALCSVERVPIKTQCCIEFVRSFSVRERFKKISVPSTLANRNAVILLDGWITDNAMVPSQVDLGRVLPYQSLHTIVIPLSVTTLLGGFQHFVYCR